MYEKNKEGSLDDTLVKAERKNQAKKMLDEVDEFILIVRSKNVDGRMGTVAYLVNKNIQIFIKALKTQIQHLVGLI